jgi:DNA-binding SARP family transcriptional activator
VPRPTRESRLAASELLLFGQPVLRMAGKNLEFPSRKLLALLTYLALQGSTSRAELAGLLWDAAEDRARANLRGELYRIRDTPFAELLEESDGRLSLAKHVTTDLALFENLLSRNDLRGALALRRGMLFEGFDVPEIPDFEDWLLLVRERWQERYLEVLAVHASQVFGLKQWQDARDAYQEILDADPWREEALRGLMRSLAQAGDVNRALERFERFRVALKETLGVEPAAQTTDLVAQLRKPNVSTAKFSSSLIGRSREWSQIEEAWNAGIFIFIYGEPGVGKTRLALDFAKSKGAISLIEGNLVDAVAPLGLSTRILQNILPQVQLEDIPTWVRLELGRLVPEYALDLPNETSGVALEGKIRLFEAITQFMLPSFQGSKTIVIDNAQFLDITNLELGGYLSVRVGQKPFEIKTMLTFRNDELHPEKQNLLNEFVRSGQAIRVDLERLDLGAVKQWLAQDPEPNFDASRLHTATGGNPFFMLETLNAWRESGMPSGNTPQPRSVGANALLQTRLERLQPGARDLARVAALSGSDFGLLFAARVLNSDALGLSEVYEQLEQAGIMQMGRFSHDLMTQAVLDSIPALTREVLHSRILEALEAVPFERGQAATRLRHATAINNTPKILFWAEKAAFEALELFAFQEAASYFQIALEQLAKLESDTTLERHLRLGLEQALTRLKESSSNI